MFMKRSRFKSLLMANCVFMQMCVVAGTIEWNVPVHGTNLDSSGARMGSGFVFQLGVFSSGFHPTASNIADWDARWHVADTAAYNPKSKAFGSSIKLADNTAPFTAGAPGWIMGTKVTPGGTEKILFRRAKWSWPVVDLPQNPPAFPREWTVSGDHEDLQVILASVNPEGSPHLMRSTVVRNYEQWRNQHLAGEASAGPGDDPAGDGVPNLMKFAFGMDPRGKARSPHTPVERMQIGNETFLKMSIPRNGVNLARMRVEVSSDLIDWHHGPAFLEVVSENERELVVRDRTPFSSAGGRRFMRLRVELP